jgi:elongation factor 1-gamma
MSFFVINSDCNPTAAKSVATITWVKLFAKYVGEDLKIINFSESFDSSSLSKKEQELLSFCTKTTPFLFFTENSKDDSFVTNDMFCAMEHMLLKHPTSNLYDNKVEIKKWLNFNDKELVPVVEKWLDPVKGVREFVGKEYGDARKKTTELLTQLNTHLSSSLFFVGDHYTIADLAIASTLIEPYCEIFDPRFRNGFKNLTKWFETIITQPEFVSVIGPIVFATKEKKAQVKKEPKEDIKKVEKTESKNKEVKQNKPKKKEKEDNDDGDDDYKEPKKPKSVLESLPPSKMIFDVVKKNFFSVRPINDKYFLEFWQNFDAEGYSIYLCNYKYNSENKVYFMTKNLLNGFVRSCDDVRKYGLGVTLITGVDDNDNPPYNIGGLWIFRGQNVPDELPDTDYYDFKKLDPSSDSDKQTVQQWFLDESVVDESGKATKVLFRVYVK